MLKILLIVASFPDKLKKNKIKIIVKGNKHFVENCIC